jgi:hypothetical protein
LNLLHDFTSPHYIDALTTSIKYGLFVVLGMLAVGGVLTLLGGGTAALGWAKQRAQGHH